MADLNLVPHIRIDGRWVDLRDIIPHKRRVLSEAQLLDLKSRLHQDRTTVMLRGHSWDVADVIAVVEQFDADISS